MDDDELTKTFEIARLDLRPGDTVVVRCRGTLNPEQLSNIQSCASHVWPDHKVVAIDENMEIQVVRVKPGMKLDIAPAFKKG